MTFWSTFRGLGAALCRARILIDFWTQIEDLGFEEAFKSNFGKSADEMILEFDIWVDQPVEVLLEIIP